MTGWIQDWFGSEYYCMLYKHRNADEAKLFLGNLVSLLKLSPKNKILDCGCGRGRHSIYLAEKEFDVTGIDISEKNIAEAKKSEKENLTFYIHDQRNFFRINYYNAVLSLFTSFGYFERDAENNKAVKSMTSALKKDGWLILDFMNSYKEIKELIPNEKMECKEVAFEIKRFIEDNSIVKEISVTDNGKGFSFREQVKAYTQRDLENFFAENGLEVLHLFGDYSLNKFDETKSERLILIGKKK
ncbi:MAG: class I SAM-dependent methyltransferase [Bacteroidetes bacterium]|nr:class I SAM-dependent methyltransferase [Bacteroidota bacterium]